MHASALLLLLLAHTQVHVRHLPASSNSHLGQNWLADLTQSWKEAGLWITRAKVGLACMHKQQCIQQRCEVSW